MDVMNKRDYCNTISGIRWSEEKRRRMEALLKLPADSVEFEMATEYTEVAHVSREEIEEMQGTSTRTGRRNRKMMMVLLAAAILAAGGGGMAVAMSRDKMIEQPDDNSGIHLTDSEAENSAFGSSFWYHASPAEALITETENGWYYEVPMDAKDYQLGTVIMYADKETGTQNPLCTRPDCAHDGDISCVASTKAYTHSRLIYAEGNLYALGVRHANPEKPAADDPVVLMRYALDGSAVEEVADLGAGDATMRPIAHRGFLWFAVTRNVGGENGITGSGWEIVGYELATGKLSKIVETYPAEGETKQYVMPERFYADGDFLYFNIATTASNRSPLTQGGLNRVNLLTGEITGMVEKDIEFVSDGCAFYGTNGMNDEMMVYSLETGMSHSLGADTKSQIFVATADYVAGIYTGRGTAANPITTLEIYQHDGTQVAVVGLPTGRDCKNIAILNGVVYLHYDAVAFDDDSSVDTSKSYHNVTVDSCPLENILAQNFDFRTIYKYSYVME